LSDPWLCCCRGGQQAVALLLLQHLCGLIKMTATSPILVNESMRFNIPNNNITWRRIIGDGGTMVQLDQACPSALRSATFCASSRPRITSARA
jgi:hypothetical protein